MVWAKIRQNIWLIILLGFVWILYSYKLDFTPVHLNQDEVMFALNAKAIASSARDYYGNFLPFYFLHLNSFWATPAIVYWTSLFLIFLPYGEAGVRLAVVGVAVISTALVYKISENIFASKWYGFAGAVMLATTPALFINSRLLLDNIFPVVFVLLWLFLIRKFLDSNKSKYLFLSGLALGVGWHSYHAAHLMMPIYFKLGLIFFYLKGRYSHKKYVTYLLGALVPIVAFVPWLAGHPDTLLNQVSYVGGLDGSIETTRGIFGVVNLSRLGGMIGNYFSYFSPRILFFEGDRSLIHSTGQVGVFLYPIVFLLFFGVAEILKRKDLFGYLVLFGFLSFPIAPAIVNEPQRISRGLTVVPFAILISVYGVRFIFRQKDRAFGYLFFGLILAGALQFKFFLNDYYGDYRERSAGWFNNDIGGAFEGAIAFAGKQKVEATYVDSSVHFGEFYYDFYAKKLNIQPGNFIFFDPKQADFADFKKGSLVVLTFENASEKQDVGEFGKIMTVAEPDGKESFYVYYRE